MATAAHDATKLAFDIEGDGMSVVFLHGLTFDRRSWRPIVARLGGSVRSIAIDLPAHGDSRGVPAPLEEIAVRIHELLGSLAVERPIVVGHSMSAGLACLLRRRLSGARCGRCRQRPGRAAVRRAHPEARARASGPGFADAWPTFENSLGLERIPAPLRSVVLAGHQVDQDVVVGYWEPLLRADPAELQASIDDLIVPKLDKPCLGMFGRPVTEREHERFARLADVRLEEWPDDGHCVHLVHPDRFAASLRRFVDYCSGGARA